jgi:hypothetical protein
LKFIYGRNTSHSVGDQICVAVVGLSLHFGDLTGHSVLEMDGQIESVAILSSSCKVSHFVCLLEGKIMVVQESECVVFVVVYSENDCSSPFSWCVVPFQACSHDILKTVLLLLFVIVVCLFFVVCYPLLFVICCLLLLFVIAVCYSLAFVTCYFYYLFMFDSYSYYLLFVVFLYVFVCDLMLAVIVNCVCCWVESSLIVNEVESLRVSDENCTWWCS